MGEVQTSANVGVVDGEQVRRPESRPSLGALSAYVAILCMAAGVGATLVERPDYGTTSFAAPTQTSTWAGILAVVGAVALLLRARPVAHRVREALTDPPYLMLIGLYVLGALVFALRSDGSIGPMLGVARFGGGILVGLSGILALGRRGFMEAVRMFSVLVCAGTLVTEYVLPEAVYVGVRNNVYGGLLAWNSGIGSLAAIALVLTVTMPRNDTAEIRLSLTKWMSRQRLAAFAVALYILVRSASRTAQIALAVDILLCVILALRPHLFRWGVVLLGTAVAVVLLLSYGSTLFGLLNKDTTLTGRSNIWPVAIDGVLYSPTTGYGLGNFWRLLETQHRFRGFTRPPDSAHNQLLEVVLGGGVLTLVPVWLLIRRIVRHAAACLTDEESRIGASYAALVILIAILSLTTSPLFRNGYLPAIFYALSARPSMWWSSPAARGARAT